MFPIIETERLILREIREDDLDRIYEIFSNMMVTQFYGQEPITTKDQALGFISHFKNLHLEKKGIRWGIERRNIKGLIGTIGFHLWSPKHLRAEIGYEILPDYWGKGYAKESILNCISYGFNEMKLHRIGAVVFVENQNSNKLLEKIGFEKEGILKDYMYQNGQFYDTYAYSLLKNS